MLTATQSLVMAALAEHGAMTIEQLAADTGFVGNAVRRAIDEGIPAGLVTREAVARTTRGRPGYVYRLAGRGFVIGSALRTVRRELDTHTARNQA